MKQTIKKNHFFLLSILLAVIAIAVSAFKNKMPQDKAGSLTLAGSEGGTPPYIFSCTTSAGTPDKACNVTADTTTTHMLSFDSYQDDIRQTTYNTTTY